MKKLSLLVGTLGGAMAGYLFSNKKLRDELAEAKDADAAAKLLGRHLQRDGKKFAEQVQEFVESDDVQKRVGKAKKYADDQYRRAKAELSELVHDGTTAATKTVRTKTASAKKKASTAAKKAKKESRKNSE